MGGPDANPDPLKQSISAVRASGGFPGNVLICHNQLNRWGCQGWAFVDPKAVVVLTTPDCHLCSRVYHSANLLALHRNQGTDGHSIDVNAIHNHRQSLVVVWASSIWELLDHCLSCLPRQHWAPRLSHCWFDIHCLPGQLQIRQAIDCGLGHLGLPTQFVALNIPWWNIHQLSNLIGGCREWATDGLTVAAFQDSPWPSTTIDGPAINDLTNWASAGPAAHLLSSEVNTGSQPFADVLAGVPATLLSASKL